MAQSLDIGLHQSNRRWLLVMGLLSTCIATNCGGNTLDPAVTREAGGSPVTPGTGGALQGGGGTTGTAPAGGASSSTGTATIWDGGAPGSDFPQPGLTGGTPASNVGGSSQNSSCADYNAARALSDGLLEACRIASSGSCKATLQEYLTGQSALATISLAEGCGTRTVGWDARLGGRLFTYDQNDVLLGFKFWDDIPNGPCKASGTYSYSMGSSRTTLIQASSGCVEDVVCTVALTDASQLHCPTQ
jgi:hypothetical protein